MSTDVFTPFELQHICDSINILRVVTKNHGGYLKGAADTNAILEQVRRGDPFVFTFLDRDRYLKFLDYIGDRTNPDKKVRTLFRTFNGKVRGQFLYATSDVPKETKDTSDARTPATTLPKLPPIPEPTQVSGPMLVRIMASTCRHCGPLKENWPAIEAGVRQIIPNLRTIEIEVDGTKGPWIIDSALPSDLNKYTVWFPMIILINGNLWDKAMAGHKRGETVPLREGVLINNGAWIDGVVRYVNSKHLTGDVLGWVRSLSSAQLEALNGPAPETKVEVPEPSPEAKVEVPEPAPEAKVEVPEPPPPVLMSTSEGPLDQLVINQSIVQSTYDVLGQIKSLRSQPLRRFLAQAVIQEMAPYL
jgi:hypothetical protein